MKKSQTLTNPKRVPALFIGHGNPMLSITDNLYREAWVALGKTLPRPKTILCISAHWETNGTQVCVAEKPETIHDFGGFPAQLFAQQYPAPGAPECAKIICDLFATGVITPTIHWGLDHGAWTILQSLFPAADVPVLQLSLDKNLDFAEHFALAQKLAGLREQGVMMIGSGNIVHNLSRLDFTGGVYDWAVSFDDYVKSALETANDALLIKIELAGDSAKLAVPTVEHYLPLLYIAAMRHADDNFKFFNESFDLGALSMRSIIYLPVGNS
jgi:4,5-DOPA dioxygenase extradiol